MTNKINFTKVNLDALVTPTFGRIEYHDNKTPGLKIRITSNGIKTFSVLKRVKGGSPMRSTLGRYPEVSIEQARRLSAGILAEIAEGGNPAEVKRAIKGEPTFADLFDIYYNLDTTTDSDGNTVSVNQGMSTIYSSGTLYPFKQSSVRNPVRKIMLAEEVASMDKRDNPTGTPKVINDGRWVPSEGDPLTGRHGGKADVTFADGHVQPETWEFGDDITNSEPDL